MMSSRVRQCRACSVSPVVARSISRSNLSAVSGDATRVKYCQMSSRSCLALGAQTTRLGTGGTRLASLPDNLFDLEFLALAGIELFDADIDLSAQLAERLYVLEQLAPELLLGRLWKRCRLRHRDFKCLDHDINIARFPSLRTR